MIRTVVTRATAVAAALGAVAIASGSATAAGPVAAPGYQLSVFAKATSAYSHPDSLTADGNNIYVGYQNAAAPDGSSGSSTVVQYRTDGTVVHSWTLPGKNDGLRVDPRTKKVWALTNEDANPHLTIIDPSNGSEALYSFATPPHGGGYDDFAFTRDGVFISASAPNPEPSFHKQAVAKVELVGNQVQLTPILYDDSTVTSRTTGKPVQLQLTDPDSMSVDSHGNVVLDSQADQIQVIIHEPGTSDQWNEVLPLSDQVDDSAWTGRQKGGRLLIADHGGNTVYWLSRQEGFAPGTAYSAAPSGSPVAGIVGTLNTKSGAITPVVTGLTDPHGLIWVGSQQGGEDGGDSNNQDGSSNNQ